MRTTDSAAGRPRRSSSHLEPSIRCCRDGHQLRVLTRRTVMAGARRVVDVFVRRPDCRPARMDDSRDFGFNDGQGGPRRCSRDRPSFPFESGWPSTPDVIIPLHRAPTARALRGRRVQRWTFFARALDSLARRIAVHIGARPSTRMMLSCDSRFDISRRSPRFHSSPPR